jgi:hypothetical protein
LVTSTSAAGLSSVMFGSPCRHCCTPVVERKA